MKHLLLIGALCFCGLSMAQKVVVESPDNLLNVTLDCREGKLTYTVDYNGKRLVEESPLGLNANIGNYSEGLSYQNHEINKVTDSYTLANIKQSEVSYEANRLAYNVKNADGADMTIVFQVSNNDVAFCYELAKKGETGSVRIMNEVTGYKFPAQTTTFLTPQSDAMIGWKRTKPSYEEEYKADRPMNERSQFGKGYTFPCLFRVGEEGWVLLSETGVDSRYCASHLSDYENELYTLAFPMPEENNGNGSVEPAFSLPGATPWRTITVGTDLKPIVETTIPWDVVKPRYESANIYNYGKGTWSWILWQDNSINYDDQVKYIDLANAMGFRYTLVDNWWNTNIGHEGMERLSKYAKTKNVELFVWYSSSGYWNDIVQGPTNIMSNSITRKKEMKWLNSIGAKGIKVDFFGGDKQETMRLYEDILSDADDHGLMVIFHGCTLPRGWERMYPNYAGSEAILASENLIFAQHWCDTEAFYGTLHPFIRNTVGSMEWGGSFLNKRMNKGNDGGNTRRTSDTYSLATAVLFQNPIQNFALAPNNLSDAPAYCLDFLRNVPTTWDETRFIEGYPGKYAVLARRSGKTWYIAAINAMSEELKLNINLNFVSEGDVTVYDDKKQEAQAVKIKKQLYKCTVAPNGGVVVVK